MKILAFDTCFQLCSVAYLEDGVLQHCAKALERNNQAEKLIGMIDEALVKAGNLQLNDLDHIIVTNGPGSFTGVRIGLACAAGFASAMVEAKIHYISTFQVAWHTYKMQDCLVIFKAVRDRYYTQYFQNGQGLTPKIMTFNEIMAEDNAAIIGMCEKSGDLENFTEVVPDAELLMQTAQYFLQKPGLFSEQGGLPLYVARPDAYGDV